ncbi:ribosomal pre-60S maturation factor [Lipomyces kononenkoae]|uniref:Ribosomal pre-60S maturation factor n=1 Tax=Lipomyces kononenkoae TaxID=34357 RepID=A0ACC3SVG2_LIPKO
MPSKNSINKPKLAVQQSRKSATGQKRASRLSAARAFRAGVVKSDGVVHGRVLSKKQSKKDERNRRYLAQRGVGVVNGQVVIKAEDADGDEKMSDIVQASRTQLKKAERQQLFAVDRQQIDKHSTESMEITSTGKGTTLGGPPAVAL